MKKLIWLLGVMSVLILEGIIFSPFYSFYQIANSIAENDTEKLSHYVEFHELRKNLKEQLNQTLENKFVRKSIETESRFSDVAYKFAQRFSNRLVDAYVTPQGFGKLMGVEVNRAQKHSDNKGNSQPSKNEEKAVLKLTFEEKFKLLKNARFSFASTRTFVISMPTKNDKIIKFVLSRDRFLWKLNNIILPISN